MTSILRQLLVRVKQSILVTAKASRRGWSHWTDSTKLMVTGVGTEEALPLRYALEQNFPDPANPTTHFGFRLSAGQAGIGDFGHVSLRVYDILGREVATLVNGRKAPGSYEVKFDASGLASSVYLYRLNAGRFVETREMVLMR